MDKYLPDTLVDLNSDGVLGHVENASGSSVVSLEGHSLLEGSIALDVNDVASLVDTVEGGEGLDSVLLELTGEHIARSAPDSLWVDHFWPYLQNQLETARITTDNGDKNDETNEKNPKTAILLKYNRERTVNLLQKIRQGVRGETISLSTWFILL